LDDETDGGVAVFDVVAEEGLLVGDGTPAAMGFVAEVGVQEPAFLVDGFDIEVERVGFAFAGDDVGGESGGQDGVVEALLEVG
jgi:hypothetical protein